MTNENWLKEDEICPTCGAVTKKQRGLTKQNVKRLFSFKFDANEIIFTILIILVIALAIFYNHDTKQCRDWIKPMFAGDKAMCESVCDERCSLINANTNINGGAINLTNITIINDTKIP